MWKGCPAAKVSGQRLSPSRGNALDNVYDLILDDVKRTAKAEDRAKDEAAEYS